MDRLRRTMMFVPGNNPGMIRDAHIYGADSLMFDLEDSVSLNEKDSARFLVYNALKTIDYGNVEIIVRVNPLSTPFGKKDVEAAIKGGAHVIRMPKTETPDDIKELEAEIEKVEAQAGIEKGSILIMAAVESALGIVNAYNIATASPRMTGIALGAEDYCANLKVSRTKSGQELLLARQTIVIAARAAGISAVDTVFADVNDMDTFIDEVTFIKTLGFDGKSVINPRQIGPVHQIFAPSEKEINDALRIVAALNEAEAKGSGVISLNGKMIDKPVVLRAQRVLDMAKAAGMNIEEEEC